MLFFSHIGGTFPQHLSLWETSIRHLSSLKRSYFLTKKNNTFFNNTRSVEGCDPFTWFTCKWQGSCYTFILPYHIEIDTSMNAIQIVWRFKLLFLKSRFFFVCFLVPVLQDASNHLSSGCARYEKYPLSERTDKPTSHYKKDIWKDYIII